MAKGKVQQLTAEQAAVGAAVGISDVEREELVAASASANAGEEETDNRLSYRPRTAEGQKAYEMMGRPLHPGVWVSRARNAGHSLDSQEVGEVYSFDGPEMACPERGGQCNYHFRPVRVAAMSDDGSFVLDARLVNETNQKGIVYRGAYLVVPVDTKKKYSLLMAIGPMCRRCQQATGAVYNEATGKWPKTFAKGEAEAFVVAVNAAKETSRKEWVDRKATIAREYGIEPRGGGGRNPHQATSGRQNRGGGFKFGDIARFR